METHEVFNQVPPFEEINLFSTDQALTEVVSRNGGDWAKDHLLAYGQTMGTAVWMEKGRLANAYPPVFHSHDRMGQRVDSVEFHPAYHDYMRIGLENGLHSLPWTANRKGAHFARLGMYYVHAQNEAGTGCPITMTFSCVPAIQKYLPQSKEWLSRITHNSYDPDNKPWEQKTGLTIGMAMTEKQGGTDVRANTTKAHPLNGRGPGQPYALTGHKWFCSAPMCDAFLTLAQTEKGLSCFLLPRWRPDGTKNGFQIQRLKDKLGNRSNASSEMEYHEAFAWLMGEEGRGVPTIIEMVAMTRYDCMIGSSALMRRGLAEAMHHAKHRSVMGKQLIDQPLMQNVLADLALESEAALLLTERVAQCLENAHLAEEKALLRLLLPVGKYWITKRANTHLAEAMECLGGNGYVESSPLPRLYREGPVNAIWEGSGNVQCLDVIRALAKTPGILEVFFEELAKAKGSLPVYDHYLNQLQKDLIPANINPVNARSLTERMAKALQAAQCIQRGNPTLAEGFCLARLSGSAGLMFGTLPDSVDFRTILDRV